MPQLFFHNLIVEFKDISAIFLWQKKLKDSPIHNCSNLKETCFGFISLFLFVKKLSCVWKWFSSEMLGIFNLIFHKTRKFSTILSPICSFFLNYFNSKQWCDLCLNSLIQAQSVKAHNIKIFDQQYIQETLFKLQTQSLQYNLMFHKVCSFKECYKFVVNY